MSTLYDQMADFADSSGVEEPGLGMTPSLGAEVEMTLEQVMDYILATSPNITPDAKFYIENALQGLSPQEAMQMAEDVSRQIDQIEQAIAVGADPQMFVSPALSAMAIDSVAQGVNDLRHTEEMNMNAAATGTSYNAAYETGVSEIDTMQGLQDLLGMGNFANLAVADMGDNVGAALDGVFAAGPQPNVPDVRAPSEELGVFA